MSPIGICLEPSSASSSSSSLASTSSSTTSAGGGRGGGGGATDMAKDSSGDSQFVQTLLIENCKLHYELLKLKQQLTIQNQQQQQQSSIGTLEGTGSKQNEPDSTIKDEDEKNPLKPPLSPPNVPESPTPNESVSIKSLKKSAPSSGGGGATNNNINENYENFSHYNDLNSKVAHFLSRQSDPTRSINRELLGYGMGRGIADYGNSNDSNRRNLLIGASLGLFDSSLSCIDSSSSSSSSTMANRHSPTSQSSPPNNNAVKTGKKHRLSPLNSYDLSPTNRNDSSSLLSSNNTPALSTSAKIALFYDNNGDQAFGRRRLSTLECLNRLNSEHENFRSSSKYTNHSSSNQEELLSFGMKKMKTADHYLQSLAKSRRLKAIEREKIFGNSGSDDSFDGQLKDNKEVQKVVLSGGGGTFDKVGEKLLNRSSEADCRGNTLISKHDVDVDDEEEGYDFGGDEDSMNKLLSHFDRHRFFVLPTEAQQTSDLISFDRLCQSAIDQNNVQKSFRAILELWQKTRHSMSRLVFLYHVFDYLMEKYLRVDFCTTHNPPCRPQVGSTRFGKIAVPIVKAFLQSINRARHIIVQVEILSAIESLCYNKSRFRPAIAEIFDHLFNGGLVEAISFSEWSTLDDFTVQHFPTSAFHSRTSSESSIESDSPTVITTNNESNKSNNSKSKLSSSSSSSSPSSSPPTKKSSKIKKSKNVATVASTTSATTTTSRKNRTVSSCSEQQPATMRSGKMSEPPASSSSNRTKLLQELNRAGFSLLKKSFSII